MIHVNEKEVEKNLPMADLLEKLREVFVEYAEGGGASSPRVRTVTDGIVMNTLPAMSKKLGVAGLKTYVITKGGIKHVVLLFNLKSSELLAVMEARKLGQMRTGAVPAVITQFMRGKQLSNFTIVGSGFQAESQIEAMATLFDIEEARVFSRSFEKASRFAAEASKQYGIQVSPARNIKEALRDAAVVNTITNSTDPIFTLSDLGEVYHLNLTGSNMLSRREVSDDVMLGSDLIVVEHLEQSHNESSEVNAVIGAHRDGNLFDMRNLILNPSLAKGKKRTVFKTMGIGLEDITAGYVVLKNLGVL